MLVSYNWLKDIVAVDTDPAELADQITLSGIEIADVNHPMAGLKKIVAGKVLELADHPDSDHLHVAQVDVGEEEPIQIVCGAPNIAVGQTVIVALHGARIADNQKIKRSKMRGVVSNGMICGLDEIGFSESVVPKEYADGIYVFEEEITPGTPVYHALGMDDYILDFDITPNRADTLSMSGAAYEVGAIVNQKPHLREFSVNESLPDWTSELNVEIETPEVKKYLLRKVTNVANRRSPMWLQTRLMNAGIRPISLIVDITNYVMLETGQPLHAFDYDKVRALSETLNVNKAQPDSKLTLLNGEEVELDAEDLVIFAGETPIGLAGVMGGLETEITATTKNVLIESAIFDGGHIRKTAQRHNLRSEASNRFEKGLNPDNTRVALDMAAWLLNEYAAADTYQGVKVGIDSADPEKVLQISLAEINHVLGTKLDVTTVAEIFARLQFETTEKNEIFTVTVPNRRFDISINADLIEEVARIYGYQNLPLTLPTGAQTLGGYSDRQIKLNQMKKMMVGLGLVETINYSLTSREQALNFMRNPQPEIAVAWPLNSDRTTLRQNLMSGLVDAAIYNANHNQKDLGIFEQGRVFYQNGTENLELEHLAALYSGTDQPTNWQHLEQKVDFYFVKGQLEALFAQLGLLEQITFEKALVPGYHAGRTAQVKFGEIVIGYVGQLDPRLIKKHKLPDIYGFELNLEPVMAHPAPVVTSQKAPKFPSIKRDLSLLCDQKLTNAEIIATIKEFGGKYLTNVTVFDVYSGEKLEFNKKSLAYQLTFYNDVETLTDEVVKTQMEKIMAGLAAKLNIVIR